MPVGYEIDFLAVGEGTRGGDAIAMRYGEAGAYNVHVVDGGDQGSGERLVAHIREHYGTDRVDFAVLTHADADHASGLRIVLEELNVTHLVMNRPWVHAEQLVEHFKDKRWTVDGLRNRLRADFPMVAELEDLAASNGVQVHDAFAGLQIGDYFKILAPSRQRYLSLVPQFTQTPAAAAATPQRGLLIRNVLQKAVEAALKWVPETWAFETLPATTTTSAANESSVVQFGNFDGAKVLLTGDVGVEGLEEAANNADSLKLGLPGLSFMQVPHHGSRHNVSPRVLNRFLGSPIAQGQTRNTTAYASVAKGTETHPRKVVRNAFMRRGAEVHATAGMGKRCHYNMPTRNGWGRATPLPFSDQVEG